MRNGWRIRLQSIRFLDPQYVESPQLVIVLSMAELDPILHTVAWIAPLEIDAQAALEMLDNGNMGNCPIALGDDYIFKAGGAGGHNMVIVTLPPGQPHSRRSADTLPSQVGVAAELPNLSQSPPLDIRLGDVLVGLPVGESARFIAYDLGKEKGEDGFYMMRFGHALANKVTIVRSAIGSIKLMAPHDKTEIPPYYKHMEHKEH
ncbi:hypothetical protein TARUN_2180 [Trichoderma arundinaceum]|uniref:Uncharacterized protein n=1 Tax=Trichoderma arundinaceum TaxID=490622 RepID=A0A395NVA0_TRIAR|nr:hypothetical protein TARUN_2180 [Trichoderma arundinaceum]